MRYLIYVFILFYSSLSAQTFYQVDKKKLDILLDNYFYDFPSCTLALDKSHQAIDSLKFALQKGVELIDLRTLERDLKVKEVLLMDSLRSNTEEIHRNQLKSEKKKGNKKGIIGIALGVIIGVLLI